MIDPNAEVLAMPAPPAELESSIRLGAQADYALTFARLLVATDDPGMRGVKALRNQLSSLRCRCSGFNGVPEQTAALRTAALEAIGQLDSLAVMERMAGREQIPHIRKALELMVNAVSKPKKAAA